MTATASGTFAGTPFANAAITVTSVADTSQVFTTLPPDAVYDVFPSSSSISIAGFATATFTDQTFWEDPNGSGDIIFGVVNGPDYGFAFCSSCDGLLGFLNFNNSSYDLQSSFGPVSGGPDFEIEVFNAFQNIPTSEGSLSLDVVSNDMFTAVSASTLIDFQGGPSSMPVPLPSGLQVAEVTGTIGGFGSQDYYSFLWDGGAFDAAASITGAPNAEASYLFSEGVAGSCSSGGTATLDSSDSFAGTIGIADLAPGQYCIGIDATSLNDPGFTLNFNTPVTGTGTPEPSGFLLLSIGLGMISVLRLTKRSREHS